MAHHRAHALLALGATLLLAGCNADLRGVGGPDLDSDGIAVSGQYPGFYPYSERGTCSIAGSGDARTLSFATRGTKSLVPRIVVSLPEYRGPGLYAVAGAEASPPATPSAAASPPLGIAQVTASLGTNLHWQATDGQVRVDGESAREVHGSIRADIHELASDGFGDRPVGALGRWSCDLTSAGG